MVLLVYFSFCWLCFRVLSKNSLLRLVSRSLYPVFSSKKSSVQSLCLPFNLLQMTCIYIVSVDDFRIVLSAQAGSSREKINYDIVDRNYTLNQIGLRDICNVPNRIYTLYICWQSSSMCCWVDHILRSTTNQSNFKIQLTMIWLSDHNGMNCRLIIKCTEYAEIR